MLFILIFVKVSFASCISVNLSLLKSFQFFFSLYGNNFLLGISSDFTIFIFLSVGGVTSGWFCIESTILTLAISATAFSFYKDRTTQKARRMFHASLLYLPVFMSGILFHRISDNQQCHAEESSESIVELSMFSEDGNVIQKDKLKQHRPPVSYASVAPFPFLPVPSYAS